MADRKTSKGAKEETAEEMDSPAAVIALGDKSESTPEASAGEAAEKPEAESESKTGAAAAEPEPEAAPEAPAKEGAAGPVPPIAPPPAPESPRRSGGALGAILGGVVAAAIGFGLAQLVPQGWPFGPSVQVTDSLSQRLDTAEAALSALKTQVAALDKSVKATEEQAASAAGLGAKISAAQAQVAALKTELQKGQNGLDQSLKSLEGRVAALEKMPQASGTGAPASAASSAPAAGAPDAAALASLSAQIEAQRKASADLAAQIKSVGDKASAGIAEAEKQAQQMKADAEATAKAALARAALTRVQTALDLGGSFAPALAELRAQGAKVPAALTNTAEAGVPTRADLLRAYPAAARAALDASIKATMGSGVMDRIGAFLKTQTGLRSLKPRQGSGPDAILSRVEADLRDGKLAEAVKETDALPVVGQSAMADWLTMANARLQALQAVDALAKSLGK